MSDKIASTRVTDVSTSSSHKNCTEFFQASLEVQVTEATCLRNRLIEIKPANRAKAAQSLRAIAHLLMSGALGILLTFTGNFDQQAVESDLTLPKQGRSE